MTFAKISVALTAASLLLAAPAFAQGTGASDKTMPTGRSDSDSAGSMKSDGMKSEGMKTGTMKPATNGTSTLAGPAGKMSDPANK